MASLPEGITVVRGDFKALAPRLQEFVAEKAALCKPDSLHILDGSDEEFRKILSNMELAGMLTKLPKYEGWYVFVSLFQLVCA